jgi:hypothetical protein
MSLKVNDQARNEEKQANKRFDTTQFPFPSTKMRRASPVTNTSAVMNVQQQSLTSTPVVSNIFLVDNQSQSRTTTPTVSLITIGVT